MRESNFDKLVALVALAYFFLRGIIGERWDFVVPFVWTVCLIVIVHAFGAAHAVSAEITQEIRSYSSGRELPLYTPSGDHASVAVAAPGPMLYRPRLYGIACVFFVLCAYFGFSVWELSRPAPKPAASTKDVIAALPEQTHGTKESSAARPESTLPAKKRRHSATVPNAQPNIPEQQSKEPAVPAVVPSPVSPSPMSLPASQPQSVDALAAAVAKKLGEQQPAAAAKPCRSDDLSACTDEALIQWGKPLVENITRIQDRYMAEMDIMKEFEGDKFLKGMKAAERSEVEAYRNCCAEDALRYEKELASRVGGGRHNIAFAEWTEKLMRPIGSPDWKSATEHPDTMILDIRFKLPELERALWLKKELQRIEQLR